MDMNLNNDKLFALAVEMIRGKRYTSLEIAAALEHAAVGNLKNARDIIYDAEKYIRELDAAAEVAAIEAFRRGETSLEVEKKLRALGFHSWDAGCLAAVCAEKAAKELAVETASDK